MKTKVSLKLYDVSGRFVRTLLETKAQGLEPGAYDLIWDGKDDRGMKLSSGTYFYRLEAEGFLATRKLVLIR
jgi:flagellar hook assembly protein FlgD